MVVIKKYENRRLYDTAGSRYVNLEDIRKIVESGEEVSVVDARAGADRTREVLLQVLLERPEGLDLLPPRLLHRVIRAGGDDAGQALAREQLRIGLELVDAQIEEAQLLLAQMVDGPMVAAEPPGPTYTPFGTHTSDPAWRSPSAGSEELDELRAELGRLEERLRR